MAVFKFTLLNLPNYSCLAVDMNNCSRKLCSDCVLVEIPAIMIWQLHSIYDS